MTVWISQWVNYFKSLKPIVLRLSLVYAYYFVSRIFFYLINIKILGKVPLSDWPKVLLGGFVFDSSAIFYTNLLFVLLWLIPVKSVAGNKTYQKILSGLFLLVNLTCISLNVIDLFYFEFNLKRMTADFSHWIGESNTTTILLAFLRSHILAFLVFIGFVYLFIRLSFRINNEYTETKTNLSYFAIHSLLIVLISSVFIIGMRGGYTHSSRPITLSNAGKYVGNPGWMPLVLNTPFSLIRTFDKQVYTDEHYMTNQEANSYFNPAKKPRFPEDSMRKLNVVIIILESYAREHSGYLNPHLLNGHYEGYTPFLDSLMQESLVCTHAFANGRKSIDAMPSILASIPSLLEPYVLSHNSLDKINTLATLLKPYGYQSAFFHGAPNGSMGFDAFTKIAGIDEYYGKDEFNNDGEFDGIWGIWDEPFFQFFNQKISSFKQPFLGVCFSVSSHHPFILPKSYQGKIEEGILPVHKCVRYTDLALQHFFEAAKKEPWFENTLFIVSADHSTISWSEEYNNLVGDFAIPILYYCPRLHLKGRFEKVTQQTDIMPSVLDLLHYPKSYIAFGNSIFDSAQTRFALSYLNDRYEVMDSTNLFSLSDAHQLTALYDTNVNWNLSENLINKDTILDRKTLRFHQAVIQQYNHRILKDSLTIHQ